MRVLVTGGAGYIGSFMTIALLSIGHEVIVLDNLKRGRKENVSPKATLIKGDILDKELLNDLFSRNKIDTVLHFAGLISMEESVQNPNLYMENNFVGSCNLIQSAVDNNVKKFIFSSTAGIYGNPIIVPIPEDNPTRPTNPYGESKLKVEKFLREFEKLYGLNFVSLRYFNAAGASLDGKMGEEHTPETHIIPLAINAVLDRKEFNLYGNNYPTEDGTCIRDYIHVLDLVEAHVLAMNLLEKSKGGFFYNVGTGNGFSNRQVLTEIERVSGQKIKIVEKDKRPGDAVTLIADSSKIKQDLGFEPKYSDLQTIISSAFKWHSRK